MFLFLSPLPQENVGRDMGALEAAPPTLPPVTSYQLEPACLAESHKPPAASSSPAYPQFVRRFPQRDGGRIGDGGGSEALRDDQGAHRDARDLEANTHGRQVLLRVQ
eukprot:1737986-Pleurochrysis_carterae.AAC.1